MSAEPVASGSSDRLKVFVSYARANVDFADQLVMVLEDKGYVPILDRRDIDAAENWRERLGKLIFSSDACVFVLTAASAASSICRWEVEEATRLGKRVVPAVPDALKDVAAPPQLSDLNWIHFYADAAIPGSGFYHGVRLLDRALRVDLRWLRQQTKLAEDATEWDSLKRPDDLLMRGLALKDVDGWLQRVPSGVAVPSVVRDFINASQEAQERRDIDAREQIEKERAQIRRQKRMQLLLGALTLLVLISSSVFGVLVWRGQRDLREEQQRVEAERRRGQESRAQVLSNAALNQFAAGNNESALRLALAGVREGADVGGVVEANAALLRLLDEEAPLRRLRGHVSNVISCDVDRASGRIATLSSDGRIIVRTPGHAAEPFGEPSKRFTAFALLPGGGVVADDDFPEVAEQLPVKRPIKITQIVALSTQPPRAFTLDSEGRVRAWRRDGEQWERESIPDSTKSASRIGLAADGAGLLIGNSDGSLQALVRANETWTLSTLLTSNPPAAIVSLQQAATGRTLLLTEAGETKIWDNPSEPIRTLTVTEPVTAAALGPAGDFVLIATKTGVAHIVDIASGRITRSVQVSTRPLQGIGVLPDAETFAVWGDEIDVPVFSLARSEPSVAAVSSGAIQWRGRSADSREIGGRLTLGEDGALRIVSRETGAVTGRPMTLAADKIVDFGLAPDGSTTAALTARNELHLFDAKAGLEIARPIDDVAAVEFAPDGSALRLIATNGKPRLRPLVPASRIAAAELISRACSNLIADPAGAVVTQADVDQVVILEDRLGLNLCATDQARAAALDGRRFGDVPRIDLVSFARSLDFVLRFEGGYSDVDRRNAINMGVTQKAYDAFRNQQGLSPRDVKLLERPEAQQIYLEQFWRPSQAHRMPTRALALIQFDAAVNMGSARAIRFSETAAGIAQVDGVWDPSTQRDVLAAAQADPERFARQLIELRRGYYEDLTQRNPKLAVFLKGWLGRLDALEREAEALR